MPSLSHIETVFLNANTFPTGITDLDIHRVGTQTFAIATTGLDGGIITYSLGDGMSNMRALDQFLYPDGSYLTAPLQGDIQTWSGQTLLTILGNPTEGLWGIVLEEDGQLGERVNLRDPGAAPIVRAEANADGTVVIASTWKTDGLTTFGVTSGGRLQRIGEIAGAEHTDYNISTNFEITETGGREFAIATSAQQNTLTTYRLWSNATLTAQDRVTGSDGVGFQTPVALEVVSMGGSTFVLVGAHDSQSISVFSVDSDGSLVALSHTIDTLNTRFAGLSQLETVTINDQVFVLASGSDDGFSVMRLLPNGRLLHIDTVEDTLTTTLDNISALTAVEHDGWLDILASSETEGGISRYRLAVGNLQSTTYADGSGTTLDGTIRPDILVAGDGGNRLSGGAGNDILMDGAGQDTLTGGTGADVFVMSADSAYDAITDFNPTEDTIDLSAIGRIYSVEALNITSESNGATIQFGGQSLRIFSHNNSSLRANDLAPAIEMSLSQYTPVSSPPADQEVDAGTPDSEPTGGGSPDTDNSAPDTPTRILGNARSNELIGGNGDDYLLGYKGYDRLKGGAGADTLDGGSDRDMADYSDGTGFFIVDLKDPSVNTGIAAGDVYINVENLLGSASNNSLRGNDYRNVIYGGDGRDWIVGYGGDDTLYGELGSDIFLGGEGSDFMVGGWGTDRADYRRTNENITVDLENPELNTGIAAGDTYDSIENLFGSVHRDTLFGNSANNRLWGGDGGDALIGRDGNDIMFAGAGDDVLQGGTGGDQMVGGSGFDRSDYRNAETGITVDMIYFERNTGEAAGDTLFEIEAIFGSSLSDTLRGDGQANTLWGYNGNDYLDGREGPDQLFGQAGGDALNGGLGNDTMTGGEGADTFLFSHNHDVITDFTAGKDKLRLDDWLWDEHRLSMQEVINQFATIEGAHVRLTFNPWHDLLLLNTAQDINQLADSFSDF